MCLTVTTRDLILLPRRRNVLRAPLLHTVVCKLVRIGSVLLISCTVLPFYEYSNLIPSGWNFKTRPTARANGWIGGLGHTAAPESNNYTTATVSGSVRFRNATKRAGRTSLFDSGVITVSHLTMLPSLRGLRELRAASIVCFTHLPEPLRGQTSFG
ncbi:hypothetical protein EI94DRAFT_569187 [Lactarius quietus]|nr:hypothetical protein EI94DRAFT_569187 [Lactarius quietus]